MRILILGAKGMLGQALAKTFSDHELHLWDREDLDITDFDFTRYKITELEPELIINAAAYTNVDAAEENFELAKLINGDAPINLARVAEEINATFVHYSTDYVFDGIKEDGYNENDEPNPISRYGESKAFGEAVLAYCEKCYLIRTSRLFGFAGTGKKSFVEKMLELAETKTALELVDEEISKPTYVKDLATQTRLLVEQEFPYGIYHVTNEGECTWFDFAKEIFKIAEKKIDLTPVSGDKFPRLAKRPLNSSLINEKLPIVRAWHDSVREFISEYNELKETEKSEAFSAITVEQVSVARLNQEVPEKVEIAEKKVAIRTEEIRQLRVEKPGNEITAGRNITASQVVEDKIEPVPPAREIIPSVVNAVLLSEKPEVKNDPVKIIVNNEPRMETVSFMNNKKGMKGIILSGGKGTRLYPLTKITSKQLLPVYNKPMIMYPLETLIKAGIKEILIIVAPEYAGQYLQLLGSGKEFGVKLTYEIQDEPKGLPEAFVIGEKFIDNENVTMILGDNIFFDHDFTQDINSFEKGGRIFAVHVPDPERFGVVEFNEDRKVVSIEEKPTKPKSNYAIPGIYIFDSRVCQISKNLKPTWRPETEIVDVHRAYLEQEELDVRMINGRWLDAGTFDSLLKASNWMATKEYQKKMGYDENYLNKK